jgi:arylsulfatase
MMRSSTVIARMRSISAIREASALALGRAAGNVETNLSLLIDMSLDYRVATENFEIRPMEMRILMGLQRTLPLILTVSLLPLIACGGEKEENEKKPLNILLLYADDWRHDTLGAAGNPVVKTPVIDKLAAEGIRFTDNFVTTSICGIARASVYTGQWMSRHGCRNFKEWKTPWEETYLGLLRENGYHLGHVGKWHNGKIPKDKFDFSTAYHGKHWYPDPESGEKGKKIHVTQRNERDVLKFLSQRPKDKPFYLTVAFFATHAEDPHPDQFLPQPESMELYKDVTIPVPPNATRESWERLPDFFDRENEGRNRWYWRFDTPEKYQRMMKNYYRMATEVDTTCGRILEELKAQGVLDNTLVIFTTDNGYYHGEHGLADKWYPHEESIRVPLVIRDPRLPKAQRGSTSDAFTLNVDLAPTILACAGIGAPKNMQGRRLDRLYLDKVKPEWRTEFFYEHPTLRDADFIPASEALVRREWKYFYWPEADLEQLFHIKTDPREENDLASDPDYAEKLKEMRKRFNELKAAAK